MCGIVGFIDNRISKERGLSNLLKMSSAIKHRGPDDEGIFYNEQVFMGHRRLSILDLSKKGHQPMSSFSKRYICSFNGEIYNYKTLKIDLEKNGYSFNSSSDTEVLLALIESFGFEEAIKKCIGMFAIALWDNKENIFSLARDRFGEKPLYWGRFWFKNKCL